MELLLFSFFLSITMEIIIPYFVKDISTNRFFNQVLASLCFTTYSRRSTTISDLLLWSVIHIFSIYVQWQVILLFSRTSPFTFTFTFTFFFFPTLTYDCKWFCCFPGPVLIGGGFLTIGFSVEANIPYSLFLSLLLLLLLILLLLLRLTLSLTQWEL